MRKLITQLLRPVHDPNSFPPGNRSGFLPVWYARSGTFGPTFLHILVNEAINMRQRDKGGCVCTHALTHAIHQTVNMYETTCFANVNLTGPFSSLSQRHSRSPWQCIMKSETVTAIPITTNALLENFLLSRCSFISTHICWNRFPEGILVAFSTNDKRWQVSLRFDSSEGIH